MFADLAEGVLQEFADRQMCFGEGLRAVPPEGFHIIRTQRRKRCYSAEVFQHRQEHRRAFAAQAYGKRIRAMLIAGQRPKYKGRLVRLVAAELGIDLDAPGAASCST